MYLVIDTSGDKALVALGDSKGVISFGEWPNGQDLSRKLQPEIDKLLRISSHKPQTVFCVTGPGSFTSIRIGVASANAMAYAWQVPVVGLTRFEIYESADFDKPYVILLENIRDLFYAKICRDEDCEYFVGELSKLSEKATGAAIGGEYLSSQKEIGENFGQTSFLGDGKVIENKERAEIILRSGERILKELGPKNFTLPVTPLYINRPNITKPKKK